MNPKKYFILIFSVFCLFLANYHSDSMAASKKSKQNCEKSFKDQGKQEETLTHGSEGIVNKVKRMCGIGGCKPIQLRTDYVNVLLKGVRLKGKNLSEQDFSNRKGKKKMDKRDFSHTNLSRASFENTNLKGAKFYEANLQGANLRGANLRGAILIEADLRDADLTGTDLTGAHVDGALLQGAILDGTIFEGADLKDAHLEGTKIKNVNFKKSDLGHANLEKSDIKNTDFTGANLNKTNMSNTRQKKSIMKDASLKDTKLEGAHLLSFDFAGVNLKYASTNGLVLSLTDQGVVVLFRIMHEAVIITGIRYGLESANLLDMHNIFNYDLSEISSLLYWTSAVVLRITGAATIKGYIKVKDQSLGFYFKKRKLKFGDKSIVPEKEKKEVTTVHPSVLKTIKRWVTPSAK